MRSTDGLKDQLRTAGVQEPLPGDGGGASRRDFMWATGATGIALALTPSLPALAQEDPGTDDPDMGWDLVGDEETLNPEDYDYQFFGEDQEWMEVYEGEEFDFELYRYQLEEFHEDGGRTLWVEARPEEALNHDEYEYREWDTDEEVEYETVYEESRNANFFYSHEYTYPEGNTWYRIVPGEDYDAENWEYAYQSS